MQGSFDRFTERARKVLTLAQEEAQRRGHDYIGTEHLLLGLVREGEGVAAKVLSNLSIELDKLRTTAEAALKKGTSTTAGDIGLTRDAKKVIELAVDEARRLGHHYIGTEHLLLGLVRHRRNPAGAIVEVMGVTLEKVRSEVIKIITETESTTHHGRRAERRPHPDWRFLVVPTVSTEGAVQALPFWNEVGLGPELANMRIQHVLKVLGDDGWELVAIAPDGEETGSLYVFRRPS